jgi:hypothetical protein
MKLQQTKSKRFRACQRGQAMTEYVVVCGAITLALGISMLSDNSILKQFFDAFASAYDKFSYAISLVL